jgi:NMD protein affecting ribosome stability and mRNA decay
MKCQRCANDREAEFQVVSDAMNIKVCAECGREARKLGRSLNVVEIDKAQTEQATDSEERMYQTIMAPIA